MGGGSYCFHNAVDRRMLSSTASEELLRSTDRKIPKGYRARSCVETFQSKNVNNAMNPYGITLREARDSAEHPMSVPIIVALDVTGSMGNVPHFLVQEGLPLMMRGIIQAGVCDPQVLFLAIGDHECDRSPLQVGQFESSDVLLDKWLTDTFLEGGGGGNLGESYALAWYFAANHTATDHWDKRGKKGFLFTVGDEPVLPKYPAESFKEILGLEQASAMEADQMLRQARERYHVFHIHLRETASGSRADRVIGWRRIRGCMSRRWSRSERTCVRS